ncbi:MAG: ABC transporter ATP-binding protein [Leptolyngbyaceae cyanobacterium]
MTSCIEALGIGVIGPFIALASDFSLIEQMPLLARVREVLNIEQENHFVAIVGLFVVTLFLIKTLSAWATQVFIARFSDQQQRLLIIKMTRGYLEAPYVYHITKNSSSITDRLIEIANSFSGAMFMPLLTTAANVFLFIALFTLLCFTSLPIMIGLLATLLPILIYFNSFARKVGAWGKQMRESKAGIIQTVNHAFGSVKETKNIGCEAYFEDQIAYQARKLEKAHRTFIAFKILPRFVLESVIVVSVIVTISISIFLNGAGVAGTTSVLGVFALASVRLLPAITNFINGVNQLRASSYTVDQIYHELRELSAFQEGQRLTSDRPPLNGSSQHHPRKLAASLSSSPSPASHLQFRQQVRLKGLTYRYPSASRNVIADLSLAMKKGESIAFIGKSGAGKTTLVDIILGLLIPQSGDIEVDGVSVYQDLRAWKNLIAYIPQTIFLIDDSIEKNIAFGVPDHLVDREKIARAIHVAQLTDVIAGLPNGVETLVGERGVLLSGGQRQRVGIARAIYHDREILVLDEATAALDNETEKLVTDSIASLSSSDQITLITIAHRLSTIKGCDRIYMLGDGQIVKSGTYAEVVDGEPVAGENRKSLVNAD